MLAFNTKPVPHAEAAKTISSKPAVSRDVFDQMPDEIKAISFTVSGIEDYDALQAIRDRVAELPEGADWNAIKKDIVKEMSPWLSEESANRRADILLHHHGFSSYASAQAKVMDELTDIFPYRQYISTEDGGVRPSHAALNGIIIRADHSFWKKHTPPWEWNCRCDCVEITEEEMKDEQKRDKKRDAPKRRVLEGPALKQLEHGSVNRGPATNVDIRTPRERGGNYENDVRAHGIPYDQIKGRWDKKTRTNFETWADHQDLSNGTLLDSLLGREPTPGKHHTAGTPPQPNATKSKTAVSNALVNNYKTNAHKKPIATATNAIDAVHDDGVLPQIPLRGSAENSLGRYRFYPNGKAYEINIKSTGDWAALTTVHEIGHFLDHHGVDAPGAFSSHGKGTLSKVIDSIKKSTAYSEIAKKKNIDLSYWLRNDELWARSYAQYIATRSGDKTLLGDVSRVRASFFPDRQWDDKDFTPIADEIDIAFAALGWNPKNLNR